jgi:hypothetical protein
MNTDAAQDDCWICYRCHKKLELKQVSVLYLGGRFEVELMQCPQCKMVIINENLALGKMLEVEKGLEDK